MAKEEDGTIMITTAELMILPFEEARAKIDALTDEERAAMALATIDWLIERLKMLIAGEENDTDIQQKPDSLQSVDTDH